VPLALLAGRPPDQVGIVVSDLDAAVERYSRIWGLGPWRGWLYGAETIPRTTFRGGEGRFAVRIALAGSGPQVELLQPVRGPSIYHEFAAERGEGLHHLGFLVPSLAEAVAELEGAGYAVLQSGAGYGRDGDGGFAYFDTATDLGVILEAIEVPTCRRDPDFTWPAAPDAEPTRAAGTRSGARN
jgi:methylmalonyl-CoA/ethylmalonyl-CoA epimerase